MPSSTTCRAGPSISSVLAAVGSRGWAASPRDINEEKWPESDFKDDLDSALAQVEAARTIYRKAMGRIDAASWHKSSESTPARNAEPVGGGGMPRSFLFWLKVGVAIALPLIAAFGMLTVFLLHRLGYSPAL